MTFEKIDSEFVFEGEMSFASCHASTLVVVPGETVVAAWFGGSQEGADDVAIWLSRRVDGVWSPPTKVADDTGVPNWNPVLFRARDGRLLLLYKVGRRISDWYTKYVVSNDDGKTWSVAQELVPGDRGGRGPVRNKIICASSGAWLAPASIESDTDDRWQAFTDISIDEGKTWKKSNIVEIELCGSHELARSSNKIPVSQQSFKGRGIIQPTLWESAPNMVHMLLRSTEGQLFRSDSLDGGNTWCDPYPVGLPNNNSGIDVVRMDDGLLVLAYNPVGYNWGPRTPIALISSLDNGKTWRNQLILEDSEGEFSYPAILAKDDKLFLTYTWKRKTIAYWSFRVARCD